MISFLTSRVMDCQMSSGSDGSPNWGCSVSKLSVHYLELEAPFKTSELFLYHCIAVCMGCHCKTKLFTHLQFSSWLLSWGVLPMAGGRQLAEVHCLTLVLFQKVVPYFQKNRTASVSSSQEHTKIYLFTNDIPRCTWFISLIRAHQFFYLTLTIMIENYWFQYSW